MQNVKSIGGYFSLELPLREEYHKDAIRLNTGRNCLEYILRARSYKKVYVPYYTCEVILEPFKKLNIAYEFYHINLNFEVTYEIQLNQNEALLYTNYYGLKQQYIEVLAEQYGQQLIVDNTQAFYAKPIAGIDTFYTCRKFFGVPDGAYLYTNTKFDEDMDQDMSYNRMAHLLKRIDLSAEDGYLDFRNADDGLDMQPIRHMSKLTYRMMLSIDYKNVACRRRENFLYIHKNLKATNQLNLSLGKNAVPMVYPYLTDKIELREFLISKKVFVACYWPNVIEWTKESDIETTLSQLLLPLPIDQRYGKPVINFLCQLIKDYQHK